ncbi:phytase [Rhodothalassium salexigens]|uniref:phytase n=1 Tax=Rhodothalassium salexigens TaxID=1086 RepID=UPI001912E02D|nr:phytase [Rhodothalassium salexigens]
MTKTTFLTTTAAPLALALTATLALAAPAIGQTTPPAPVLPSAETDTVDTLDDAADDAAIWVNPDDPAQSLILGTDKTAGLRVYGLDGAERQMLATGRLNNVDLIQGVATGQWSGDLAAASNRSDDSVALFSVTAAGAEQIGRFSVGPEPYGLCMGRTDAGPVVYVAHKQGYVQPYRITDPTDDSPEALKPAFFDSQIEGCAYDGAYDRLYVGEEVAGLWAVPTTRSGLADTAKTLVYAVGDGAAPKADIEGVTLYETGEESGYILISSQGDDSYHVLTRADAPQPVTRFRLAADARAGIDGTQETDGIAATPAPLGADYPQGLFVVQDGFNVEPGVDGDGRTADDMPKAAQNFKLIDWRRIAPLLDR